MNKKLMAITFILILLVFSSTLCIDDNNDNKKPKKGPWLDLTYFNDFLEQNYDVILKEESGASLIKNIDNASGSLYIVVGTDEPFTESEAAALHHFVESGGRIIVAADNTNVNNLSKKFGVEYSEHAILDKAFDYNYTFIPITVVNNANFFDIVVHSPRGLSITAADYVILGESSERPGTIYSVLDKNDNNIMDSDDEPGPIPIVVQVRVKDGVALFIADAGLFTNNLWNLVSISDSPEYYGKIYQNQEYINDIVTTMHEPGCKIIYDVSKQTNTFSNFHPYPTD